jgi:hypothetical protein
MLFGLTAEKMGRALAMDFGANSYWGDTVMGSGIGDLGSAIGLQGFCRWLLKDGAPLI